MLFSRSSLVAQRLTAARRAMTHSAGLLRRPGPDAECSRPRPMHLTCTIPSAGCAVSIATCTKPRGSSASRSGGRLASKPSTMSAARAAPASPGPKRFAPAMMRARSAPGDSPAGSGPMAAGARLPGRGWQPRRWHSRINCARAWAPRMWSQSPTWRIHRPTGAKGRPHAAWRQRDREMAAAELLERTYPPHALVAVSCE